MKCLSRRATFTPPFSPSWDIQVLEAALARARREDSFIAASRVRLGGSDAKRERKGERGADLIEARKRLHLGGGGKGLRAGIRVKSLPP